MDKRLITKELLLIVFSTALTFIGCTGIWHAALADEQSASDITIFYTGADDSNISGSDLFGTTNALMPGDSVTSKLTIKNNSSTSCQAWIRAVQSSESDTTDADDLALAAQLSITNDLGEAVYVGDLTGQSITSGQCLGTIAASDHYDLTFNLNLPCELGNEYASKQAVCGWVVTIAQNDDDTTTASTSSATSTAKGSASGSSSSPTTGDSLTALIVSALALAISGSVIIGSRIANKRKEKTVENRVQP